MIVAALGYESAAGDFEVVDLCFPGVPAHVDVPLPAAGEKMDVDGGDEGSWIALVSGLGVQGGNAVADLRLSLLVEYLMGEAAGDEVRLQRRVVGAQVDCRPAGT